MALTNTELESALNAIADRLAILERLVANVVSTTQINAITLLIEKDILDLQTVTTTTKNRVTAVEAAVADIV